tara:strand:+ start:101476 stop:101976 length:501 start_codon:yes stop_codon:yes gene_type:complete
MANYNEQVNQLWDEWISETGQDSGDPSDFIDWAIASRRLAPRPQDIKQILRKQVTQALRQAKRYDEEGGFTYRAKQSVTLFENGNAIKHYFDTDTGGTQTLRQKSIRQRREAVAHDVYRGVCDAERMSKMYPEEPQLNFFADFTDDVAELRAAESLDRDEDDENTA